MSLRTGRVLVSPFHYPPPSDICLEENELTTRLNYMASRIRAALCEFSAEKLESTVSAKEKDELDKWWWKGLEKELVSSKKIKRITFTYGI